MSPITSPTANRSLTWEEIQASANNDPDVAALVRDREVRWAEAEARAAAAANAGIAGTGLGSETRGGENHAMIEPPSWSSLQTRAAKLATLAASSVSGDLVECPSPRASEARGEGPVPRGTTDVEQDTQIRRGEGIFQAEE